MWDIESLSLYVLCRFEKSDGDLWEMENVFLFVRVFYFFFFFFRNTPSYLRSYFSKHIILLSFYIYSTCVHSTNTKRVKGQRGNDEI